MKPLLISFLFYSHVVDDYFDVVDGKVNSCIIDCVLQSSDIDRLIIYSDSEISASESDDEDITWL